MSQATMPPTSFYGKQWIFYVTAIFFTLMVTLCAIMGPQFWAGTLKKADGGSAKEAGVALTIFAVLFTPVALLAWFNIAARRKPLLRIDRDGLTMNIIGASDMDGVPLIPGLLRVAWLVLTGQGFRQQVAHVSWPALRSVELKGVKLVQALHIYGAITFPYAQAAATKERVIFRDSEFRNSLANVAGAIEYYRQHPDQA